MAAYAKAFAAGIAAFLASIANVLIGDAGFGDITDGQWVFAVLAFLGGLGITYAVPNKP